MTHALWRINILGNLKKKTNSEIITLTNFEIRVKIRCPAFDYLTLNIVGRFLVCLASDRDDWGQKKTKLSWQLYNPLIYWKTLINNVWWLIYFTTHDDTSSMTLIVVSSRSIPKWLLCTFEKVKRQDIDKCELKINHWLCCNLQANWLICPNLEVRHKMEVVYV